MKKHSGFGEAPARLPVETKLIQYLARHSEGISTLRMGAWIDSCSRGGGYTLEEFSDGLRSLRGSGRIAFACGVWYLRGPIQKDRQ